MATDLRVRKSLLADVDARDCWKEFKYFYIEVNKILVSDTFHGMTPLQQGCSRLLLFTV